MKKKYFLSLTLVLSFFSALKAQQTPRLLLRLDDNGMNHSVNHAIERIAATGMPFSTSVMFACPWYQEAVEILKQHPHISVGVHLTLNSEWKYYRWGPVIGKTAVPSLVDSVGYFHSSTDGFLKSGYKLDEVEKELDAQIQRAINSGLQIDYVDYHMGTAVATPELRKVVEKLAAKYDLGISQYFGEIYQTMFSVPIGKKKEEFLSRLDKLEKEKVTLMVMHLSEFDNEMKRLVDMNNSGMRSDDGEPIVALHRSEEMETLLSKEFRDLVKNGNIKLVTYRDIIKESNLKSN